ERVMSTLVVLLGADSPLVRAVTAVLHDWSTVGLVHDHVWVDVAEAGAAEQAQPVPATAVWSTGRRAVQLRDHIADQRDLRRLRLCALSMVGGDTRLVPGRQADALLNELRQLGPPVTAVNLLLARHGGDGWPSDVARSAGWQNVVVAPEDAWDPGSTP